MGDSHPVIFCAFKHSESNSLPSWQSISDITRVLWYGKAFPKSSAVPHQVSSPAPGSTSQLVPRLEGTRPLTLFLVPHLQCIVLDTRHACLIMPAVVRYPHETQASKEDAAAWKCWWRITVSCQYKHPVYFWVKFKYQYIRRMWHWIENPVMEWLIKPGTFLVWLNQGSWFTGCFDTLERLGGYQSCMNWTLPSTDFFQITMI